MTHCKSCNAILLKTEHTETCKECWGTPEDNEDNEDPIAGEHFPNNVNKWEEN